jgi:hypothetical protein
VIPDSEIVAALRARVGYRRVDPGRDGPSDYAIADVKAAPGMVDLAVRQRCGPHARVAVALPSTGSPQFWLYAPPEDADDWVDQFLVWTDEEVFTGGLGGGRARTEIRSESYVIVEPYGWRVRKQDRHDELAASAGPEGWNAGSA